MKRLGSVQGAASRRRALHALLRSSQGIGVLAAAGRAAGGLGRRQAREKIALLHSVIVKVKRGTGAASMDETHALVYNRT